MMEVNISTKLMSYIYKKPCAMSLAVLCIQNKVQHSLYSRINQQIKYTPEKGISQGCKKSSLISKRYDVYGNNV